VSSNEIVDRISQAGEKGVRKTELKKEFQNSPFEDEIGSLIGNGDIVMDKKGTAYYLWRPDDYMKYLLTTDTKFRLLYNKINEMKIQTEDKFKNGGHFKDPDGSNSIYNHDSNSFESWDNSVSYPTRIKQVSNFDNDNFRKEFDSVLKKCSGSSGWVLLSRIREEMEREYNLRQEEFYSLVKEITDREYDAYELSSGGTEGITIRGLLHGFVRCI
jgi:hypothetical protein